MKIVERKTFMQMPKGTVFCKFPRFNEATFVIVAKGIRLARHVCVATIRR